MAYLYLTESDLRLGFSDGQITVRKADGTVAHIPLHQIEGIAVFGMAQLTTQLIRKCIESNIQIDYYSNDGHYFGSVSSNQAIDPSRQKRQMYLTDNQGFCLEWSKRIISAKIKNSICLLESASGTYDFSEVELKGLNHSLKSLEYADTVNSALGYEGNAARNYFECLSRLLVVDELRFKGRSSRPPKDPFNSMLSFGYSLLYRDVVGAVERHGLHPYFAFMHRLHFGHAALASDLMEEYRTPLIDMTVLDFANSGEVDKDDFYVNRAGAVYMSRDASRKLTAMLSDMIVRGRSYFTDDNRSYGFQAMLDIKLDMVVDAIEHGDASRYQPYIWKLEK